MTDVQQKAAAKQFAKTWAGRGDEKQETQLFWISLLQNVFGVEQPTEAIDFEVRVKLDHTSFIDGYIKDTHVLIEQKGMDIDLQRGYKQSDGTMLTPYGQARRYAGFLPHNMNPRWIVVCNFKEFHIHDMNRPNDTPEIIRLEELEKEYHRLQFLVDAGNERIQKEMEISLQAGDLVGKLYDALLKQYNSPASEEELKSLNALCVRLVFCLYAEDAGIFGSHTMFHDYLSTFQPKNIRKALIDLFKVLDTKVDDRDPYMDEDLAAFPYVNGGLFADENIIVPRFTEEIIELLLSKASEDFNWSSISPTIFGAVFESTLNPETRRSGGMHYTSIENIHKVIDPLFFNDLTAELDAIAAITVKKTRNQKLSDFQKKLAKLTFLDPACGSGNFLTETYLSLRRLENQVISLQQEDQQILGEYINPIQVSIGQFYGIEINDFAVTVAKTALWIAESQMMKETEAIVRMHLDFLPLTSYANIIEGNALRTDWETIVPKAKLNYIMGNPPFVGYSLQSKEQKDDILSIYVDEKGKPYKTAGKIDYVAGWYFKSAQMMVSTNIRTAFVSTNSITQGEQVAGVWKPLYDRFGIHIDFAHRTFRWDSEASLKAHVHCVIVGFSVAPNTGRKYLFTSERKQVVENINAYLIDAPSVFIDNRSTPICDVPNMTTGNRPADGGHLIIEADEYDAFVAAEPNSVKYIKQLVGSAEFINNRKRYCLWLVGANPVELLKMPAVMKRVEACKLDRETSPDAGRRKLAERPTLFRETNNPDTFIVVPAVSSERRRYVPMGFLDKNTIATNLVITIPNANLYHFGILTSNVHMAWMRAVCGRLKSDYRYSKDVVYNNFPWPTPNEEQVARISQTAKAILDARALYPDCSMADLYGDKMWLYPELLKAHQLNDKAVMQAYGFWGKLNTETECVAELMKMYQALTQK
ncbi:MAG: class I SAM-dependent DNA methyltransferase [Ruminococcaceae bacterium]|nr:class I SAM-dependent DNA methyltransferase [Oscillospiraceae bacterium]